MEEEFDAEFLSSIAVTIQRNIRRFLSRCRIVKLINERIEKIYDPRRKLYYYYDSVADTSSWLKPALLRDSDIQVVAPTFTPDEASRHITNLMRRLRSLRLIQRAFAQSIEEVKEGGKKFYMRLKTGETLLKLPSFMEGTMRHDPPLRHADDDEDEDENDEDAEESDDEDYDSGIFYHLYDSYVFMHFYIFFL